ncbi:TldD/PmbA family protein [Candidatus Bathyarchaeota archaeon]|nr:TldD/PmbA family protein [Candidatus Bathyarchaeota archaeon]
MEMEVAELAVKRALELGATEAEAYVQRAKIIRVGGSEEIEDFNTVESLGIGLRVVLGRRIANYSTSILDEAEVEGAVAKAVKIARVSPEDPDWRRLNRRFGESQAQGYYDDSLEALDYQEVVEALESSLSLVRDYDPRVKPTRVFLTVGVTGVSIANSYGEGCERRETYVVASMRVKAKGGGLESTGSEYQQARSWREIDFEELATKASERAMKFLRARPIPGGRMPVIIRNRIFASILGVLLSGPINADWVQKGASPLSNRLGTQIASEDVHIIDDGVMEGGWGTRPFDDEGHPTQRTPVVEGGILRSFLYDNYTALKEGVESTGNAQRRGYWTTPQPSPSNLILRPGGVSFEEMVAETREGIYVEETIGEWLSNPVSGNLNATVTHGYLVKEGELTEPVKGVVISGNFYNLLKEGIELVGDDLEGSMNYYSPTVKIRQLTIAGK